MAFSFPAPTIVNASTLGGDQTNPMVAALANGGYVVAWTTIINGQSDIMFQRFDAQGTAQAGPVVANSTTAGDQTLNDIVATADGDFTLAWRSSGNAVTRSFNSDGTASSAEVLTTPAGAQFSGAQLVAVGTNQYKLLLASITADTVVEQATFNTSGAVVAAKSTITTSLTVPAGPSLEEAIAGAPGEQLMVFSSGQVVSTNGTGVSQTAPTSDIVKLQDGGYLLAQGPTGNSEEALLTGLFGLGGLNTAYTFTGPAVTGAITTDFTSTARTTFDKTMVNLGDGRVLMFWVADTGAAFVAGNDGDGLYASIFNANTGQFENSTGIRVLGQLIGSNPPELTNMKIDAGVLADGRVVLTFAQKTGLGLTGFDIYSTTIDLRTSGVTFAATAAADSFVGTAGFVDTVTYTGLGSTKVDLANGSLNSGAAAGDVLTFIENVTGSAFADDLFGNGSINVLAGGAGNDHLYGRDGNDTLSGDADSDTLNGGIGDDLLLGGSGNDIVNGGTGNDTLDGGTENDALAGNDGNDTVLGGDGVDVLYGNAGDDTMDGGAGNDFMAGGAGNDIMSGGSENDTISGGDGDDNIDGGAGADTISGGRGFNIIDGGAGVDTISYAGQIFAPGFDGVYADLDPSADPFGSMEGFEADDDVIVNVENIIGSGGQDYLAGNANANTLRGGEGNDILSGRGGNDTLVGGSGDDQFLMETANGGNDRILDFTVGNDKVLLVSSAFGNITAENIAASFVANATGTPAANASPQLIFDNAGGGAGRLLFDADGNGAGAAVLIATISFSTPGGLGTFSAAGFAFI